MWHRLYHSTAFWLTLSVLVCVIVYWRWFFTLNIFAWGDWGYQNREFIRQLFWIPQAWHREFLGMVDIGLPQYLIARLFYAAAAQIVPFVLYDRLVFLWPCVLLPAFSIFLLVKKVTKNAFSGFTGVLVYAFNSYILTLNTGELTLSTAYALGPFLLIFFQQSLEKLSLRSVIYAALIGLLVIGYDPRGFYLVVFILLLYFSYFFILNPQARVKSVMLLGTFFSIILLSNLYWIIAFSQTVSSYVGIAINTTIVGQYSYILPRPLLLFSPWWSGGNGRDVSAIQPIPWYFWSIPLFAFLGFWVNRKRSVVIFWAFVALIGIFLTKSLGEPFNAIYPWLYAHIPGFNAFRDAAKFYYLICISYSVLIGCFVSWLLSARYFSTWVKILVILIISGVFLFNAQFVMRGEIGHLMTPRHIPGDYLVLRNYILKQNNFMRVLYIPEFPRWIFRDVDHRALGLEMLLGSNWKSLDDYNKIGPDYSLYDDLTGMFKKQSSHELLNAWSIKYVVVALEDRENEETMYPKNVHPSEFISFFDTLPYLKRIFIGTKQLVVYENSNALSHFSFDPSVHYSASCPDATTCHFVFSTHASFVKFSFNEAYHPGWKIRLGSFSWWNSLWDKNYFLPDTLHTRTQYGGNAFLLADIRPGQLVTLYFAPQASVNLGTIISSLIIFLSLVLVIKLTFFR